MNKKGFIHPMMIVIAVVIVALIFLVKFLLSKFTEAEVVALILGMAFVFFLVRVLGKWSEVIIFIVIFGGMEWWKYWGVPMLGLPQAPDLLYMATAAFIFTWIVLKIIDLLSMFIPFLVPIRKIIEGE